ncbi:MAG: ABC transporter substrate-binding protein [Opitutaceae bacterium]
MRSLYQTLIRLVVGLSAATGLLWALILLWAWIFRPPLMLDLPAFEPEAVAEAEELRAVAIDLENPPVVWQDVDYSRGESADWFPKGEAPILADLVSEGRLPPVAERVGPEPVVLKGVEGIGRYGGTWLMNIGANFDTLRIEDIYSGAGLVRWSPFGEPIVPHVARAFEVSEDKRVFTFHLRRGMRWSDGEPFDARDILYYWNHEALDPEAGVHGEPPNFMVTRGVVGTAEMPDLYTVRFRFAHPNGIFLDRLATYDGQRFTMAPEHYRRQYHPVVGDPELIRRTMQALQLATPRSVYTRIRNNNNPEHPRLWPWVYRSYKANPPYGYVRNPYYFAVDPQGNQLPYFDRLVWDLKTPDMIPMAAASGESTVQFEYLGFDNYTLFMDQRIANDYQVYHWYTVNASGLLINVNVNRRVVPGGPESANKRALLNDRTFRQALSLAINREAIIESTQSGVGVPSQAAPGPESPYYFPELSRAFVQYDPARADLMLDSIGLTRRDAEGFRTFADGSRMQFYISMSRGFKAETVQLIVEDWAQVGVRAVVKERARQLFYEELEGMQHDFAIWGSNDEFNPVVLPRLFVPSAWDSDYARAWAKWYMRGGLYGSARAAELKTPPPPETHPLYQSMLIYEETKEATSLEARLEAFRGALEIAAENLWTISIATPTPSFFLVKNGVRNIPKVAVAGWNYLSPSHTGVETYFLENPVDSPGAIAGMKKEILEVTPWPNALKAEGEPVGTAGRLLASFLRLLIYGSLLLGLLLVALRHPFIARRLMLMVPTLTIISVLSFLIIQMPPGDYLSSKIIRLQEAGGEVAESEIEELRELFFLNESGLERFTRWIGLHWFTTFDSKDRGLLQGYLGRSMDTLESVNVVMGDRLSLTVVLSVFTILLTWLLAIPIGIFSAVRQYSKADYVFTMVGFVGMSIPSFLLAIVIMYLSAKLLGVNVTGLFSASYAAQPEWTAGKVWDLMKHIWVPVVILAVGGTAGMIRIMRGNLLDELRKPYVRTAMAKGVRPIRLLLKYPVRLALNPFISGIGGLFPELISGGAIVSLVLSLPTIGPLLLDALMMEDLYMAGSMIMILSFLGVMGTLVSDLLLLVLDPRIRMSGGEK